MKQIGTLEETLLLLLLEMEEGSGAQILIQHSEKIGRSLALPTIHVVLKRLEKKGLVKSWLSDPGKSRGGKRQRIYAGTNSGFKVVYDLHNMRNAIWQGIPKIKYGYE